jgi:hypothetical protein
MGVMLRMRTLPAGFIAPCLPTKTDKLPSGSQWLHEIKHDGFRIIARKKGAQVRLYSRPGNDLTYRFPLIVETLARCCLNSIPCAKIRIRFGEWPRRHSCARSHSLSSHSLPYPCPQLAPAPTAVGAQITAPAIAGSTAPTPRSSNALRACRAFMDSARSIRTPARAMGQAGAGT